MTLEELIQLQAEKRLNDVHLVELDADQFRCAHTDAERAADEPLTACALHQWLFSLGGPPIGPGVYAAIPYEPDQDSASYGRNPWEFYPIGAW